MTAQAWAHECVQACVRVAKDKSCCQPHVISLEIVFGNRNTITCQCPEFHFIMEGKCMVTKCVLI